MSQKPVAKRSSAPEADFYTACQWWTDQPNIWTPVGWKDHLFRFNVLWQGTIIAQPNLNRRTTTWRDQGADFTFSPLSGWDVYPWAVFPGDDGMTTQGWNDCPAPVLWSQRSHDGILHRQEIFAHVPGGQELKRGDEPLFAWVRLSFADLTEALPLDDKASVSVLIQAVHTGHAMTMRGNTKVFHDEAIYPRALTMEGQAPGAVRIVEPDGRIRLGVAPGAKCRAQFVAPHRNKTAYRLNLEGLKVRRGMSVDLLLPMVPTDRKTFDRELAVGYDAALKEANRFWAPQPATRASIRVPEAFVTEAIRHSERISHLLSEKNPATGKYCKINGSLVYADWWSTPGTMDLIMLMDTLGHHEFVGKYLEIFKAEQGTVVPPGDAYKLHPGYLSTPPLYKSIDWLSDNGALLYAMSTHGLLTGDQDFIGRFTDVIVKSCDWIKDHRAMKGHGGYEGILPAAQATDAMTRIQAVWNDGWNYKGLVAAVKLLKKLGHPRAAEFAKEAKDYKAVYLQALHDKCRKMPVWKDADGRKRVLVPTALSGDKPLETRQAFYLDTGPLFLVFAGLVDATDPLMDDVRHWFRAGPQRKYYRHDGNCWQTPVLDHEMSSCEPCYSWNVFHSWQLGDRAKFMEGLYSLLAGGISRQTCVSCETRGAIQGNVFVAPLFVTMIRLAVVDDQLRDNELHLLRLMPLAWLKPGAAAAFEKIPTECGPVTVKTKVSADGKTLDVTFKPAFRRGEQPARIILHIPPIEGLRRVVVNGKKISATRGSVKLPA